MHVSVWHVPCGNSGVSMSRRASFVVLAWLASLGACTAEKETPDGERTDLASERQLRGSDLPDKTLSLTFDDGPGTRTAELAEFLASEGVTATFFINGAKAPGRQRDLEAIVKQGHLLANHTQNHLMLTQLDPPRIVDEITQTDAVITSFQKDRPFLLRAPYGSWTPDVARTVNASPMSKYIGSVFWDIGGDLSNTAGADWACWRDHETIERCGDLYLQEMRAKNHGIVLMHDIHEETVDMVKRLVPLMKAEGFRFTALTDVPAIERALDGDVGSVGRRSCVVGEDHLLYCANAPDTPMHEKATSTSPVVNTLRTKKSWFKCWASGERHRGGNKTWYLTQGDDNPSFGFVPASAVETGPSIDGDPSAQGLPRCP